MGEGSPAGDALRMVVVADGEWIAQRKKRALPGFEKGSAYKKIPSCTAVCNLLTQLDLDAFSEKLTTWFAAHRGTLPVALVMDGKFICDTVNGASGTFAATNDWNVFNVPLAFGDNPITVYGTNDFEITTSDSVTVTRRIEHRPNSPAHYVWIDSPAPAYPHTNWMAAAHILQDAVDVASSNDTVFVSNGVYHTGYAVTPGYSLTNRVCIERASTLESVNGSEATVIDASGSMRGVYLRRNARRLYHYEWNHLDVRWHMAIRPLRRRALDG